MNGRDRGVKRCPNQQLVTLDDSFILSEFIQCTLMHQELGVAVTDWQFCIVVVVALIFVVIGYMEQRRKQK